MRDRWRATLVAAAAAALSLLVPPVLVVSGAVIALVTLRKGQREGILLALLASLGFTALIFPLSASGPTVAGGVLLLFWLPIVVLATALRTTVSLAVALQLAAVLGWMVVLGFYVFLEDPAVWWLTLLNKIKPFLVQAGLVDDEAVLTEALELLAPFMPGVFALNLLVYAVLALLLGRWWQSLLFNPDGFRSEFHNLRLGKGSALTAALLLGLTLVLELPLVANLALVVGVVYALQGLAVVHGAVGRANLARGWLVGLYVLMVFILPQLLVFLCVLGIADAWIDVRSRIRPRLRGP